MVDLVGIEPTTSSMPWNCRKCKLLTGKRQKIVLPGKTGKIAGFDTNFDTNFGPRADSGGSAQFLP
jgi:hypothetical protein